MGNWFVPYSGKKPAHVTIKGHKLVILSQDKGAVQDGLGLLGADRVKTIRTKGSKIEQEKVIGRLAQEADGGVVIAPADVDLSDVLRKLEDELPWLH